ncbi:MAG: carbohydrate kinase family protein [Proteobacteria bacterium]|nr:carbohydrate kinase family protein [Pseudomonadota bacterium]MDA0872672.1 carbohydrate kinase family protein [Pseudomonadota bacterium]MDA1133379.1 carbohydrate kinase family protein [Pseudomonadota bacterium]
MKNILICGSIAYDSIMVFQDQFKNHILPDQIHNLNICFYVPEMKKNFGGTAGNIAYSLKLLRSNPLIMATHGDDFELYSNWLDSLGISKKYMKKITGMFTAQAFITTDQDDNQITAFHPGAMIQAHTNSIANVEDSIDLAIIAPDGRDAMIQHAQQCYKANIPFIFDPGQGLPMFRAEELITFIEQASYIAVNDYEAKLLQDKTGLTVEKITSKVKAFIVTKGAHGSEIYTDDEMIKIDAIKASNLVDPTGCGDAFRSGLIYGISAGWDWHKTGKLASVMGAIKIGFEGGQNHQPTIHEIEALFGQVLG